MDEESALWIRRPHRRLQSLLLRQTIPQELVVGESALWIRRPHRRLRSLLLRQTIPQELAGVVAREEVAVAVFPVQAPVMRTILRSSCTFFLNPLWFLMVVPVSTHAQQWTLATSATAQLIALLLAHVRMFRTLLLWLVVLVPRLRRL